MPNTCCVPNCTSVDNGNINDIPTFTTKDKNLQKKWKAAIPRLALEVTDKTAVCALHFKDAEILKGLYISINGKQEFMPYGKIMLKHDAVPSIFPAAVGRSQSSNGNKGNQPANVTPEPPAKRRKSSAKMFKIKDLLQLEMPSDWSISVKREDYIKFPVKLGESGQYKLSKTCSINKGEKMIDRSIIVSGSQVMYCDFTEAVIQNMTQQVASISELNTAIKIFDKIKLCKGVTEKGLLELSISNCVGATRYSFCWKSDSCTKVLQMSGQMCESCLALHRYLTKEKSMWSMQVEAREMRKRKSDQQHRALEQEVEPFNIKIEKIKSEPAE